MRYKDTSWAVLFLTHSTILWYNPSLPRKISSNPYVSKVRARFLQNNIHLRVKAVCQISCFAVHLWYKA